MALCYLIADYYASSLRDTVVALVVASSEVGGHCERGRNCWKAADATRKRAKLARCQIGPARLIASRRVKEGSA